MADRYDDLCVANFASVGTLLGFRRFVTNDELYLLPL